MNSKIYGIMKKSNSNISTPTTILPVLCSSNYPSLDIFCDHMLRTEGYKAPNYKKRKEFIKESNFKVLVFVSPSAHYFFPESTFLNSKDCFFRYHNALKDISYDTISIGAVLESEKKNRSDLYVAYLHKTQGIEYENSIWMTPDEIMGIQDKWYPGQNESITHFLDSLLLFPEINELIQKRKRISW